MTGRPTCGELKFCVAIEHSTRTFLLKYVLIPFTTPLSLKCLPRPPDFEPQIGPGFYDSKNSSEEKLINAFKITEAVGGLLTDYEH